MPARRRTILLVAGPSGGGKSTFIRQLQTKQLSSQIARSLPPDVHNWPLVTASFRRVEPSEGFVAANCSTHPAGLIVHYDTTFPHRHGIHAYEADPALKILEQADLLLVANVLPSRDQLIAQFDDRRQRRLGTKSVVHKVWRRGLRIPLNRLRAFIGGHQRETMDLYAAPEWVRNNCEQWNAFVNSIVRSKPGSVVLEVEPWPDVHGGPSFRARQSPPAASALPAFTSAMTGWVAFSSLC